MDLKGQQRAERVFTVILSTTAVSAFLVGFAMQNMRYMMLIFASGVALGLIASIPEWWLYRKDPLKWAKVDTDASSESSTTTTMTMEPAATSSATTEDKKSGSKLRRRAG
mmetsp:Transcript_10486/g.32041  ORF Transcript_10486/g.32041 Transcript_10486/m.32041 type:complete len:110 (+) Transcript_10486:198-527(+)